MHLKLSCHGQPSFTSRQAGYNFAPKKEAKTRQLQTLLTDKDLMHPSNLLLNPDFPFLAWKPNLLPDSLLLGKCLDRIYVSQLDPSGCNVLDHGLGV